MTPDTANLQVTVKAAAKLMNVSERMVFMARELMATGRQDLSEAVQMGRITLLSALKQAKPEKYEKRKDGLSALCRAWDSATEEERTAFLNKIAQSPPLRADDRGRVLPSPVPVVPQKAEGPALAGRPFGLSLNPCEGSSNECDCECSAQT